MAHAAAAAAAAASAAMATAAAPPAANLSTTVRCVTNRLNLYGRNKLNN